MQVSEFPACKQGYWDSFDGIPADCRLQTIPGVQRAVHKAAEIHF